MGKLNGAHVVLMNGDRRLAGVEQVSEGPPLLDDTFGPGARGAGDGAVGKQNAGKVHLGQRLDDARAADAGDAGGGGGLPEAFLVRPELAADDLDPGLQRFAVDAHPLDRARGRTLAGLDLRAFEGGAGRRGRGQQPRAVAEHDLGIGADIDDQHRLVRPVRGFGKDHARRIGADVARDAGQDVDARTRIDVEVDVARRQGKPAGGREREGRAAQLGRVDAEQQMVHDRVADEGRVENVAARDARFVRNLADQRVDRVAHGLGHLGLAAGVHHHVGDPAHQVLAEADLRVHAPGGGHDRATRYLGQMAGDGGGADVEGRAIDLLVEAGPDGDDARRLVDRHRRRPFAVPERALQALQDVQVGGEGVQAPLLAERIRQALEIAARIVHVGLRDLDIVQPDRGIDGVVPGLGALAHDLFMDLALGRHVDDDIALDQCRAAQPAAVRQAAAGGVAGLLLPRRTQMAGRALDPELGEVTGAGLHLAAAAEAAAPAHGIEIDADGARRVEHRCAGGEPPALAGRREDDEGRFGHALTR